MKPTPYCTSEVPTGVLVYLPHEVDGELIRLRAGSDRQAETIGALRSEIAEHEKDKARLQEEVQHLTHQVIACGIAARNPDLYCKDGSPYGGKWSSKQSGEIFDHCTKLRDELAALRRPVSVGEEIKAIEQEHCRCELLRLKFKHLYFFREIADKAHAARGVLLSALDAAQRDIDSLRCRVCEFQDERPGLLAEIARLTSPPEERREIVERQKQRREMTCGMPNVPLDDIDTLLQDAARYRNAHDVLLAERDGLQNQLRIMGSLCDNNARAMAEQEEARAGLLRERDAARQSLLEERELHQARKLQIKVLHEQVDAQVAALRDAASKIAELTAQRDAAREKCERLELDLVEARRRRFSDVTEVEEAQSRIERLEAQNNILRELVSRGHRLMAEYANEWDALAAADGQQPSGFCSAHNGPYPRDCNVCFPADGQKAEG